MLRPLSLVGHWSDGVTSGVVTPADALEEITADIRTAGILNRNTLLQRDLTFCIIGGQSIILCGKPRLTGALDTLPDAKTDHPNNLIEKTPAPCLGPVALPV